MYGSTPAESIPIPKTERTKDVYYKNGKEISERHLIEAIMNNDYDEKKRDQIYGKRKRYVKSLESDCCQCDQTASEYDRHGNGQPDEKKCCLVRGTEKRRA